MKKLTIATTDVSRIAHVATFGAIQFRKTQHGWLYIAQISGDELYKLDRPLYNKIQERFFGEEETHALGTALLLLEDDFFNCIGYPSMSCQMEAIIQSLEFYLSWRKEIEQYQVG